MDSVLDDTRTKVSVVEILASRAGMSEGQLYTAVIALAIAALLALTTIPSAHKLQSPLSPTPAAPSPVATR